MLNFALIVILSILFLLQNNKVIHLNEKISSLEKQTQRMFQELVKIKNAIPNQESTLRKMEPEKELARMKENQQTIDPQAEINKLSEIKLSEINQKEKIQSDIKSEKETVHTAKGVIIDQLFKTEKLIIPTEGQQRAESYLSETQNGTSENKIPQPTDLEGKEFSTLEKAMVDKAPLMDKKPSREKNPIWSLESIISKLGILLFLLGIGFLFRYVYEIGVITDEITVGIGCVIGVLLIVLGQFVSMKGRFILSQVLFGGGIAVLYTSIFAAHSYYHIMPGTLAFPAMILITIAAFLIAALKDSLSIGIVAFIGGLMTPYLLCAGNWEGLILYCVFLTTGSIAVTVLKKWLILLNITWVGTISVLLFESLNNARLTDSYLGYAGVWFIWALLLIIPNLRFADETHFSMVIYNLLLPATCILLIALNTPSDHMEFLNKGLYLVSGFMLIGLYITTYRVKETIQSIVQVSYGALFLWVLVFVLEINAATPLAVAVLGGGFLLADRYFKRMHLQIIGHFMMVLVFGHVLIEAVDIDIFEQKEIGKLLYLTAALLLASGLSLILGKIAQKIYQTAFSGALASLLIGMWVYTLTESWDFVILALSVQCALALWLTRFKQDFPKYWNHALLVGVILVKWINYLLSAMGDLHAWKGLDSWNLWMLDTLCVVIVLGSIIILEKEKIIRTMYFIGSNFVFTGLTYFVLKQYTYGHEILLLLIAIGALIFAISEVKYWIDEKHYLTVTSLIILAGAWFGLADLRFVRRGDTIWTLLAEAAVVAILVLIYLIKRVEFLRWIAMAGIYYLFTRIVVFSDSQPYEWYLLLFGYAMITWGSLQFERKHAETVKISQALAATVFVGAFMLAFSGLFFSEDDAVSLTLYVGALLVLYQLTFAFEDTWKNILKASLIIELMVLLLSFILDIWSEVAYFMPIGILVLCLSRLFFDRKNEEHLVSYIDGMIAFFAACFMIYSVIQLNNDTFSWKFLVADLLSFAGIIWVSIKSEPFKKFAYSEIINYLYFMAIIFKNFPKDELGHGYISFIWGSFAILLLVYGILKLRKRRVYSGLVIIVVVALKLIFIDLSYIEPIWKILLFLGFGGTLLLISYFLQPILKKDELK